MGWALEHLSELQRREIARRLFRVREESGDWLRGHCPLPGHPDRHPSFAYNAAKDQFKCYSHPGGELWGDLIDLYGLVHGLNKAEAFRRFREEHEPKAWAPKGGRAAAGEVSEADRGYPHASPPAARRPSYRAPSKSSPGPAFIPEDEWRALPPLPEAWLARLESQRGWRREVMARLDLRHYCNLQREDRPLTGREGRVAIPVRDEKGRLVNIRLYLPGADRAKVFSYRMGPKKGGKSFGTPRLWPPPNQWGEGTIWLVEGEPDCICALSHGLNAVTTTGGAGTFKPAWADLFAGRDVVIAYDADEKGLSGAQKAAREIARKARLVRVLRWPEFMLEPEGRLPKNHGQDLTDWFVRHQKSLAELMDLLATAQVVAPPPEEPPEEDEGPWRFFKRTAKGRMSFRSALLAREILEEHELVTDPKTGLTYRWTGQYWREFNINYIRKIALSKLGDEARSNWARDAANQVVDLSLLPEGQQMDPDPRLICLQNGVLDVESLEIRPFDRRYLITRQLPITFDPQRPADCPRWKEFVADAIQDQDMRADLQDFFGYVFWPNNTFRKALILLGDKGQGKSTCLHVLQALVGRENCANVDLADLEDQFLRATLFNKALNVFDEIDGKLVSSKYFKSMSTGGWVVAAFKHMPPFEFRPRCKLAFSCNRLPKSLDNSDGFFDRLLLIRFRRATDHRDPKLEEALLAERDGIFAWAMVGLQRLLERGGFQPSAASRALLAEYERANNPVQAFVEEMCSIEPEYKEAPLRVRKTELFAAYKDFCIKRGFGVMNIERFATELYALLPQVRSRRLTVEGSRTWFFEGVRLAG